jgi:ketosteroid isomerase-like protein
MSVEAEVRKINELRLDALARGNADDLARYLSDDLVNVTAAGAVVGKSELLESVSSGDFKITSMKIESLRTQICGDNAIVTSRMSLESHYRNQGRSGQFWATSIYAKREGSWLLSMQQMTYIPPFAVAQAERHAAPN